MKTKYNISIPQGRFIYHAEKPGDSASKQAEVKSEKKAESDLFKPKFARYLEAGEAEKAVDSAKSDSEKADAVIQKTQDDVTKDGEKLGDSEMKEDFDKNIKLLSLGTLEHDITPAVHEKMDVAKLEMKQRISGALSLFDEQLKVEVYGLKGSKGTAQPTVSFEKLSAELSLTENLSVFAEHWNGNTQFYGLNLSLPEGKYGDSSVSVSYDPKGKLVWIEGKIGKLSGSTSVQMPNSEEGEKLGIKSVAHAALGYEIADSTKLKFHVDGDGGARVAFQMNF